MQAVPKVFLYLMCATLRLHEAHVMHVLRRGWILEKWHGLFFICQTLHPPPVNAAELAARTAAASGVPDKPARPPPPAAAAAAPARPPAPGSKASDSSISVESNEGVPGQEAGRGPFLIGPHLESVLSDNFSRSHLRSVAIASSHYLYLNCDSVLTPHPESATIDNQCYHSSH
jgi:hypothetical protein